MVRLSTYLVGAAGLCLATAQNSTAPPSDNPMFQLNDDESFNFEILRTLSLSVTDGADLGEVLVAAQQIKPGDFESFSSAFNSLADRVDALGLAIDSKKYPVSFRDARLKAASYYRAADFYLHGDWTDPRIDALWTKQTKAFNDALPLLPRPGRRSTLKSKDGKFKIPVIFYSTGQPGRGNVPRIWQGGS
ncbi:hypothetical protein NQ176_g3951 [Zarea fungicola]|uniref:Uncharacterized protein n=1 Tax=Zarea fungicola TaxID=93591 RepID=A0ACC1NGL7_9HYPO|nr:hypothetical protein NQ176_g3951 [Lecanicillium fungicola]